MIEVKGNDGTFKFSRSVRVKEGDFRGWECSWMPGHTSLGIHQWESPNKDGVLRLLSNGAWQAGMETAGMRAVRPHVIGGIKEGRRLYFGDQKQDRYELLPVRSWVAMRDIGHLPSLLGQPHLPHDPGEQGGHGINLHFRSNAHAVEDADKIAGREFIAAFHRPTGMPLTRREIGHAESYVLTRGSQIELSDNSNKKLGQLPMFRNIGYYGNSPLTEPMFWSSTDVFHQVRTIEPWYVAATQHDDPISAWRLRVLAQDIMNAYSLQTVSDGGVTLASMDMNTRMVPGFANIGVLRGLAWALRAVACALELYPNWREAKLWLKVMIGVVLRAQAGSGAFATHVFEDNLDQQEPWIEYGLHHGWREQPMWQANLLIRNLYYAWSQLQDAELLTKLTEAVKKHTNILLNTDLWCVDEYRSDVQGVARYVATGNTSTPFSKNQELVRAWDTSRAEGEPDAIAVAFRLNVLTYIPQRYVRGGDYGFMHDIEQLVEQGAPVR